MEMDDVRTQTYPEPNPQPATCRDCGITLQPGEGVRVEVSWFDWDDPDEDAQGQRRYRNEWRCQYITPCAARAAATSTDIEVLRRIAANREHLPAETCDRAQAALAALAEATGFWLGRRS